MDCYLVLGDDIKRHTDECVKVVEEAIFDMTFKEKEEFSIEGNRD